MNLAPVSFCLIFALSFAMKRSASKDENGQGNGPKRVRTTTQVQGVNIQGLATQNHAGGGFQGQYLPPELWHLIMHLSDGHGIRPLSATSKKFRQTIMSDHVLKDVFDKSGESIAEQLLTASYKLNSKHTGLIEMAMPTFFKQQSMKVDDNEEIFVLVSVDAERISKLIMRCECLTSVRAILDNINSRSTLIGGEFVGDVVGNALLSQWNKVDAAIPLTVDAFEVWATDEFIDNAEFETFIVPYLALTSSATLSKRLIHTILRKGWLRVGKNCPNTYQIVDFCNSDRSALMDVLKIVASFLNKEVVQEIGKDLRLLCCITHNASSSVLSEMFSFFLKHMLEYDIDIEISLNESRNIFENNYSKMFSYLHMAAIWGFNLEVLFESLEVRSRQSTLKGARARNMNNLIRWKKGLSEGKEKVEIDENDLDLACAIMKQCSTNDVKKGFVRNIWAADVNLSKLALMLIKSNPERFKFIFEEFLKGHGLRIQRSQPLCAAGKFHEIFNVAFNLEVAYDLFRLYGYHKEFVLTLAQDVVSLLRNTESTEAFNNVVKAPKIVNLVSNCLHSQFKLGHVLFLLDKIGEFSEAFPDFPKLNVQIFKAEIENQNFGLLLETCQLIGGNTDLLREGFNENLK